MPADATQLSPRQIWERQHEYVRNFDAAGQAELFSEDGIWELPLAPSPIPKRLEGRAAILAFGRNAMERSKQSGRKIVDYEDVTIHETTDPEIIIVEFTLHGVDSNGKDYRSPYIQVLRVRDNHIVYLKDYFSLG